MNDRFMGLEGTYDSKGKQKKGASETEQWREVWVGSHTEFYQMLYCTDTCSKLCIYVYFFLQTQITLKYSLGL